MEETLINFGSAIKVIGETADAWQVGGYAVVFDTHDASSLKDKFLKSTDFDIENGETRSLYYNHGLDGTVKKTRLGRASVELKDAGIWYQGEVQKRTDYLKTHAEKIVEGIKNGIFGTSTGAPAHLVERKSVDGGHEVTLWPISEISITPTPAEPLTSCISLKSLQAIEDAEAKATMTTAAGIPPYPDPSGDTVPIARRDNAVTDDAKTEPQIECTACGNMVPADAEKCPFCAADLSRTGKVVGKSIDISTLEPPAEAADFPTRVYAETGEWATPPAEPIKSIHNFTTSAEVVTATTDLLRTRMPLEWHADAARAAADSVTDRIEALSSVKSGRVISADNHAELSTVYAALKTACDRLGALVEAHAPEDTKSLDIDVLELELRYLEQHGRHAVTI